LDLKDIKELIALMRRNDLTEIKIEEEGLKITLRRGPESVAPVLVAQTAPSPIAVAPLPPSPVVPDPHGSGNGKLREILSPMVGTFYASPSPEASPYVANGQEVTEDSVVCIIEAMKVMNEIKAEMSGTIMEVVAESGKPVQYGQVLFRVR
jgi:acetyl-CoA carboxylase biotin carboxyl carrier protein